MTGVVISKGSVEKRSESVFIWKPKQSSCFSGLKSGGNIILPTVFNILVDTVLRQWEYSHCPVAVEELALFYVDNSAIRGTNPQRVQASLDIIAAGFASFGLVMNAAKTKFMMMAGGKRWLHLSRAAYCW